MHISANLLPQQLLSAQNGTMMILIKLNSKLDCNDCLKEFLPFDFFYIVTMIGNEKKNTQSFSVAQQNFIWKNFSSTY